MGSPSGTLGNESLMRWSVLWRWTSLQNGQSSFVDATAPNVARNSLQQAGQVTTENTDVFATQMPSVCEARSKARSKLMR